MTEPSVPESAARDRLTVHVRGRVQGVGFRWFVMQRATALGLVGWVANGSDGTVSCQAEGPRDALEALLVAIGEGPSGAAVDYVTAVWGPAAGGLGRFTIRSGGHSGD